MAARKKKKPAKRPAKRASVRATVKETKRSPRPAPKKPVKKVARAPKRAPRPTKKAASTAKPRRAPTKKTAPKKASRPSKVSAPKKRATKKAPSRIPKVQPRKQTPKKSGVKRPKRTQSKRPGARSETERAKRAMREAIERQEKEIRQAKKKLRKVQAQIIEDERKARQKRMQFSMKKVDTNAGKLRMYLTNVVDELAKKDIRASFRVKANTDRTIDAELRVPYPSWVEDTDDAVRVLNLVEEAIYGIPGVLHLSVGFTLNEKANQEGIRQNVKLYTQYSGELRLTPAYYEIDDAVISFQGAIDILENVVRAHEMLPTGMLVRFAWSVDGNLYRYDDDMHMRKEPKKKLKPKKAPR